MMHFPLNFRGVDQLHLAVLHPRKLAVYSVSGKVPEIYFKLKLYSLILLVLRETVSFVFCENPDTCIS